MEHKSEDSTTSFNEDLGTQNRVINELNNCFTQIQRLTMVASTGVPPIMTNRLLPGMTETEVLTRIQDYTKLFNDLADLQQYNNTTSSSTSSNRPTTDHAQTGSGDTSSNCNKESNTARAGSRQELRHAIPLCYPNDCQWDATQKKLKKLAGVDRVSLQLNPEALQVLEKISGPIAVISVIGPCRSGKSLLANQLVKCTGAFELGNLMDAQTMGIWMWGEPIVYNGMNVIILDTEGLGAHSATGRGDLQIGVMSLLMSSLLIWNSFRSVQYSDLEQIQLLLNSSKAITNCVAGSVGVESSSSKHVLPSFVWVLRDATLTPVLDGKQCSFEEYLLNSVLKAGQGAQDSIRQCLVQDFPLLKAYTIPPPSAKEHVLKNMEDPQYANDISKEFTTAVNSFIELIWKTVQLKRGFNKPTMTGLEFKLLLEQYVGAFINNPDHVPNIETAWANAVEKIFGQAKSQCIEFYQTLANDFKRRGCPCAPSVMLQQHYQWLDQVKTKFNSLTMLIQLDAHKRGQELQSLTNKIRKVDCNNKCIEGVYYYLSKYNEEACRSKCLQTINRFEDNELLPFIRQITHDTNATEIGTLINNFKTEYGRELPYEEVAAECLEEFFAKLESETQSLRQYLSKLKDYNEKIMKERNDTRIAQQKAQELESQRQMQDNLNKQNESNYSTRRTQEATRQSTILQQERAEYDKKFADAKLQRDNERAAQNARIAREQNWIRIQNENHMAFLREQERRQQEYAEADRLWIQSTGTTPSQSDAFFALFGEERYLNPITKMWDYKPVESPWPW